MKRLCAALLILFVAFSAFAEDKAAPQAWWGSYYMPGNLSASVFLGGSLYPSVGFWPEVEFFVAKPRIAGLVPLDISVGGIGNLQAGFGDPAFFALGAGGLVNFHVGFRGTGLETWGPLLDKADLFASLGLGFDLSSDTYDGGLRFVSNNGVRYFLTDNLAVSLAYQYWNGSIVSLGATFKLGPKENIDEKARPMATMKTDLYLMQFYTMYWAVFAYGGYAFDDASFKDGSTVTWRTVAKDKDGSDSWTVERALLKTLPDGSKWWRARFAADKDTFAYEFLVDRDKKLVKVRWTNPDTKLVEDLVPTKDEWRTAMTFWNESAWAPYKKGAETVKVKAGSFKSTKLQLENKDAGAAYTWWVSTDVPGYLVKYALKNEDGTADGELVAVGTGAKTELGSY